MELRSVLPVIGVGKGRKEAWNKPETPHSETLVKQRSGFDFWFVDIGDTVKIFSDFALSIIVLVMIVFASFLQNFIL